MIPGTMALQKTYIVSCLSCPETKQVIHAVGEYINHEIACQKLQALGWRHHPLRGWTCPDCRPGGKP